MHLRKNSGGILLKNLAGHLIKSCEAAVGTGTGTGTVVGTGTGTDNVVPCGFCSDIPGAVALTGAGFSNNGCANCTTLNGGFILTRCDIPVPWDTTLCVVYKYIFPALCDFGGASKIDAWIVVLTAGPSPNTVRVSPTLCQLFPNCNSAPSLWITYEEKTTTCTWSSLSHARASPPPLFFPTFDFTGCRHTSAGGNVITTSLV